MTVDAARRTRRRTSAASVVPEPLIAPTASIAIGEIDQTIFECPTCARPLAMGVHRCPGCGTRLLRGVALGKVAGFVAIGLAVGLLVGAGGGLAFGFTHAAAGTGPGGVPGGSHGGTGGPTAAPGRSAAPTPGPTTATPTDPGAMPPVTRTALAQVIAANDRMAEAVSNLTAALRAQVFDASEVAQILRTVSADSVFGQQLAVPVGAWAGTSAVGAQLATFYTAIHETAANGLLSSVQNRAAYRVAATAMIKQLGELPAVDAAVRSAAWSAGLDLPGPSGAPQTP